MARLFDSRQYLKNVVDKDPKLCSLLNDVCKLQNENCAFWSVTGECQANPTFMNANCGPVCKSCEQQTYENRCPLDLEKMPNAWKPGDLNELFTNITTLKEYEKYEPKVLSRPHYLSGDAEDSADYKVGPWVVVLENVARPTFQSSTLLCYRNEVGLFSGRVCWMKILMNATIGLFIKLCL